MDDVDDDFVTDASEAVADEIKPTADSTVPRKLFSGFVVLCASALRVLSRANVAARKWLRSISLCKQRMREKKSEIEIIFSRPA